MKIWYEKYIELMLRTRWLTLLGAGISALVVPMHLFQFQANVEIAEVIDRSEIYAAAVPEMVTLAMIGLAFALRYAIVANIQQTSYLIATASWAGVIVLMILYVWVSRGFEPYSIYYPYGGERYGIYDSTRNAPFAFNMVFLSNLILGSIRAFATAAIALLTRKRIAK